MRAMRAVVSAAALALAAGQASGGGAGQAARTEAAAARPAAQPLGKPVVGILASPLPSEKWARGGTSWIPERYVTSLHGAGADVVPIPLHLPLEKLGWFLERVSAVLFTGGENDDGVHGKHYPDNLMRSAGFFFNASLQASGGDGPQLPIWGTCQGFQVLSVLSAGSPEVVVRTYGTADWVAHLNLTEEASSSRLFGSLPPEVLRAYQTERSTVNLHNWGVLSGSFRGAARDASGAARVRGMRLLATNVDSQGECFGSAMEHEAAPIFATQFHPEFNPWIFDPRAATPDVRAAARYPMDFFVGQALRSGRRFDSVEQERGELIDSFPKTGEGMLAGWVFHEPSPAPAGPAAAPAAAESREPARPDEDQASAPLVV